MSRVYVRRSDSELLLANSMPEPNTGCWLWLMSLDRDGYGQWTRRHRGYRVKAHRISYEIQHGEAPRGLSVCHKCDVRSCVNPDHLWLGDARDNNSDMIQKGRQARGEKAGGAKLTPVLVREIRVFPAGLNSTAKAFGISKTLVQLVRQRKAWAHV